jgi:hypothetical protein
MRLGHVAGVAAVVFIAGSTRAGARQVDGRRLPPVTALVDGCTIARDVIGPLVQLHRSDALWLTCNGVRIAIVHPDNLLGKVDIRTTAQALEVLRLFTAIPTVSLVHMGGCVEVTEDGDDRVFYKVSGRTFERLLFKPSVEDNSSVDKKDMSFSVTRPVVCSDQKVYRLREQIDGDGLYTLQSKTVVLKNVRKLGFVHWPDIGR